MHAVVFIILQRIADLLRNSACCAYLLAFDTETDHVNAYIDVQISLLVNGMVTSIHVIAILFYESHTIQAIFEVIATALAALVGDGWATKLISVATDGAANMIGR